MKVVFPCEGSLVLMKQDLDILKAFYNTSLLQSKMLDIYKQSDTIIQVGNFNYIPEKNNIILHKAHFLTIEKMRKILGIYNDSEKQEKSTSEIQNIITMIKFQITTYYPILSFKH